LNTSDLETEPKTPRKRRSEESGKTKTPEVDDDVPQAAALIT
jgi:hypothetical protein